MFFEKFASDSLKLTCANNMCTSHQSDLSVLDDLPKCLNSTLLLNESSWQHWDRKFNLVNLINCFPQSQDVQTIVHKVDILKFRKDGRISFRVKGRKMIVVFFVYFF